MIKQINQFTWEALGNLTRGLNFVIRLPQNIIISRHYLFIKTFRTLQKLMYIFSLFMMCINSFVLLWRALLFVFTWDWDIFLYKVIVIDGVFYWPLISPYLSCGLCPLVRGRKVCRRGRKVCHRDQKVCRRGWRVCHTDSLQKSPHFGQHFSNWKV